MHAVRSHRYLRGRRDRTLPARYRAEKERTTVSRTSYLDNSRFEALTPSRNFPLNQATPRVRGRPQPRSSPSPRDGVSPAGKDCARVQTDPAHRVRRGASWCRTNRRYDSREQVRPEFCIESIIDSFTFSCRRGVFSAIDEWTFAIPPTKKSRVGVSALCRIASATRRARRAAVASAARTKDSSSHSRARACESPSV